MKKFYKALNATGASGLGRDNEFVGKLPMGGEKGAWVEVNGPLKINKASLTGDHGIHLASPRWIVRYLCDELYEAEWSGEKLRDGRYLVARKVRLVRRLPNWNARVARLFAARCAQRVLTIFEREQPNDKRPREAIETARRFAVGQATEAELETAKNAALAAHEVETLSPAAISAALAAMSAANIDQGFGSMARETAQTAVAAVRKGKQDKERQWQARLLFQFIRGERTS